MERMLALHAQLMSLQTERREMVLALLGIADEVPGAVDTPMSRMFMAAQRVAREGKWDEAERVIERVKNLKFSSHQAPGADMAEKLRKHVAEGRHRFNIVSDFDPTKVTVDVRSPSIQRAWQTPDGNHGNIDTVSDDSATLVFDEFRLGWVALVRGVPGPLNDSGPPIPAGRKLVVALDDVHGLVQDASNPKLLNIRLAGFVTWDGLRWVQRSR